MTVVAVERLAAGGDGVGHLPDGLTVFIPRTAPGDLVEVAVRERHPRFARAESNGLVRAGPGRVAPECPHYVDDRCGACRLQHLAYPVHLESKAQWIGDALRRIGHRMVPDPVVRPAGRRWHYRRKLALGRGRIEGFGLHRYDDPARAFSPRECRLADERVMDAWRALDTEWDLRKSGVTRCVIWLDPDDGIQVLLRGEGEAPEVPPGFAGVRQWWWQRGRGRPVAFGSAPDERRSGLTPRVFEQVDRGAAGELRRTAAGWVGAGPGRLIWDLYGGTGEGAADMAAAGAEVWSVDVDADAHRQPRSGVEFVTGRVEHVLDRLPEPDAIIVNPPRAGLDRKVSARIEAWGRTGSGRRMAYISCDPATLARDLARMPGLAIDTVDAVDLFPQTAHVETLVLLQGPAGEGP